MYTTEKSVHLMVRFTQASPAENDPCDGKEIWIRTDVVTSISDSGVGTTILGTDYEDITVLESVDSTLIALGYAPRDSNNIT